MPLETANLLGLRTGRASTSLARNIFRLMSYSMPLNQGGLGERFPEPTALTDSSGSGDNGNIKAHREAIQDSGNWVSTTQTEGNSEFVWPMSRVDEERRRRDDQGWLAKLRPYRDALAVRNVRRDGMDSLKKLGKRQDDISQDEQLFALVGLFFRKMDRRLYKIV